VLKTEYAVQCFFVVRTIVNQNLRRISSSSTKGNSIWYSTMKCFNTNVTKMLPMFLVGRGQHLLSFRKKPFNTIQFSIPYWTPLYCWACFKAKVHAILPLLQAALSHSLLRMIA